MTPRPTDNLSAILLMIAAMVGFAFADTLIRWSSLIEGGGAGPGQIIVFQGVAGLVLFGAIMLRSGERLVRSTVLDRIVLFRTLGDLAAIVCFTTALTRMPVGDASAILQLQPLGLVLGAALILKEKVTLQRWLAVGIGFAGAMLIMRPGFESFHPASSLVFLAVIGLTVRDLATRVLDPKHSTIAVSVLVSALMIPLGIVVHGAMSDVVDTATETLALLIASSVCAMAAYYAITEAMRRGEVSVVAPYRYTRSVAAFVIAYIFLGERPDIPTALGAAIVIAAGLWMLTKERAQ